MSQPPQGGVKTLAIRLEGDLHARLSLVAQLDGLSLTDAIRSAIETFIAGKQAEGDFAARATAMLEEIDREAALRRQQVEALFSQAASQTEASEPSKSRSRRSEPTA